MITRDQRDATNSRMKQIKKVVGRSIEKQSELTDAQKIISFSLLSMCTQNSTKISTTTGWISTSVGKQRLAKRNKMISVVFFLRTMISVVEGTWKASPQPRGLIGKQPVSNRTQITNVGQAHVRAEGVRQLVPDEQVGIKELPSGPTCFPISMILPRRPLDYV
jgi:hypothetical protein